MSREHHDERPRVTQTGVGSIQGPEDPVGGEFAIQFVAQVVDDASRRFLGFKACGNGDIRHEVRSAVRAGNRTAAGSSNDPDITRDD
jgi:hypothetical protein